MSNKIKKLIFIAVTAVIVFFFLGIINIDNEFGEGNRWLIKIPPTSQFYFGFPPEDGLYEEYHVRFYPDKLKEAEEDVRFAEIVKFEQRLKSHEKFGDLGEFIALFLISLLLIAIFIKPVFSKKIKFILLDTALFSSAYFVTLLTWALVFWELAKVPVPTAKIIIYVLIMILLHYVLIRSLRPIKHYRQ